MPAGDTRRYWEFRILTLAVRLNVAAWAEVAAPSFFAGAGGAAIAVYALRRTQGPVWGYGLLAAGLLAGWLGHAFWRLRGRRFTRTDARIVLESQLRLDTRLTAATAGLVPWPAAVPVPAFLRWRLRAPLGWFAAAVALLGLAAWAPLPRSEALAPVEKPPSLAQAEAMLEALAQAQLVEPRALEEAEARARELSRRPVGEQYSHSALEAADTLRDETAAAVSSLSRNLDEAAQALESPDAGASLEGSAGRLAAALAGLRDGAMPANAQLLAQLPAHGADLSRLTPEQREQLAHQLAEAGRRARGIAGAAGANAPVAQADPSKPMNGSESAQGAPGGVGGGERSAPLAFTSQRSEATDGTPQTLNPADLSRLALGDRLGTTSGAPSADSRSAQGLTAAGALAAPARGGEAVWVDRLTPAERAALKDLFK